MALPLHAQKQPGTFTAHGSVLEPTGRPVEVATVVLNRSVTVMSDYEGKFQFVNLKPGVYEYQVSCLGYETARVTFQFKTGRETLPCPPGGLPGIHHHP